MKVLYAVTAVLVFLLAGFLLAFQAYTVTVTEVSDGYAVRSEVRAPVVPFFLPAFIPASITLIALVVILAIVKRPSLSREASGAITRGAVALTIAAIILLSAGWSMWFSPTIDTRRYDEIAVRTFVIEPLGSVAQTFDVEKGQEFEVKIDVGSVRIVPVPGPQVLEKPVLPVFSVKIYGPKGEVVWTQTNVTNAFFRAKAAEDGTYRVEVSNPQEDALSLMMWVIDRSKVTMRPLEPLGQWLSLISIPIFALGIWLSRFKEKAERQRQAGDEP